MDSRKETVEKKQVEVVLMIAGEESAETADSSGGAAREPKVESFDDFSKDPSARTPKSPLRVGNPSFEIMKSSPSLGKPPRPPQTEALIRRRSICKPKSRLVEQPPPPVSVPEDAPCPLPFERVPASPNSKFTPKTPSHAGDEEEEEDEAVFQRPQFSDGVAPQRKWKIRVLIEWSILILAMGFLVASLTVRKLENTEIYGLHIWEWCLMVIIIFCGRLMTYWLMTIVVFMIERNFLLRKKVLYFVYGLKNSVRVCIWLGLVLFTWILLFNHRIPRSPKTTKAKVLKYVSVTLASLLTGSVLWLVKTLLVKILASSFHMNTFFDRIQESIFHQYVLQTLSGPPLMELAEKIGRVKSTSQLSFRSSVKGKGKGKGKEGEDLGVIDVGKLHNMRHDKVSAWTMTGLINVINSSGLSTISNTIENFDEEGSELRDQEITNEWDAKAAAYRIFKNVAKPGYKYIEGEDLLRFLSKEEVTYVLPLFEGAVETWKIKKSALRNWVVIH